MAATTEEGDVCTGNHADDVCANIRHNNGCTATNGNCGGNNNKWQHIEAPEAQRCPQEGPTYHQGTVGPSLADTANETCNIDSNARRYNNNINKCNKWSADANHINNNTAGKRHRCGQRHLAQRRQRRPGMQAGGAMRAATYTTMTAAFAATANLHNECLECKGLREKEWQR